MKDFKITLRVSFGSGDEAAKKHEVITKACKKAARHLQTVAYMMNGSRPPQVVLETDDDYIGNETISLEEDTLADASEES